MKIILSFVLLCLTLTTTAQVYKFKAFNTFFLMPDDNGTMQKKDSILTDFLVVLNLDKKKINTYGIKEGQMDLVSTSKSELDDSGNTLVEYEGVDQLGEKCIVSFKIFKTPKGTHVASLFYFYQAANVAMVYRLRKDE